MFALYNKEKDMFMAVTIYYYFDDVAYELEEGGEMLFIRYHRYELENILKCYNGEKVVLGSGLCNPDIANGVLDGYEVVEIGAK